MLAQLLVLIYNSSVYGWPSTFGIEGFSLFVLQFPHAHLQLVEACWLDHSFQLNELMKDTTVNLPAFSQSYKWSMSAEKLVQMMEVYECEIFDLVVYFLCSKMIYPFILSVT
jgi:hypothetical protein